MTPAKSGASTTRKTGTTKPKTGSTTRKTAASDAGTKASVGRAPAKRKTVSQKAAIEQLCAADATLAGLITAAGPLPSSRRGRPERDDHYGALLRSIVNQQLSVKAGKAIYGRLTERFNQRPPTPEELLADDPEELRLAVGLSRPKTSYMRSLAEHVLSGQLELARMDELSDEEVITELIAVKGIGEWTAHMFLMFHLERPDVLAPGDLGIRNAIQRAYSLQEIPDAETIERLAERWRPHRTLACRYLWRSLDNEP
jgi:DNA-3-methyladenine glycosylase II